MTVFRTKKISAFDADASLSGTEVVVVAQSGENYKVTLAQLLAYVLANQTAIGVIDLAGWWDQWADNGALETPEGMVLYFSKSADPADTGEVYADYMPKPRTYSPPTDAQSFAAGYGIPGRHINNGNGTLAVNANIDQWPIGIEHEFVQMGGGKITVEIGSGGTTPEAIYLQACEVDRTAVGSGTFNGTYTPIVRSTGPGAKFTVMRASAVIFLAHGNLEAI